MMRPAGALRTSTVDLPASPCPYPPAVIVRTDAVVLRAFDYGETSQIVTLYTRQHGRVGVLARGSRRPKSRFGSTLQPLAYVQVVYYHRPHRELQTLKEASHIERLTTITGDVARLTAGFRIVELVRGLTESEDPNPLLFTLLLRALYHLEAGGAHARNVLPHFELRLAELLGFAPDVRKEDVLALPEEGGFLTLARGAVRPLAEAGGAGLRASRAALRAFAIFARTDLETALRLQLTDDLHAETVRLVDAYLHHHIEGYFPDRVPEVARQLLAPPSP
jgi:DNA repair protein RecO (recombination protein O)